MQFGRQRWSQRGFPGGHETCQKYARGYLHYGYYQSSPENALTSIQRICVPNYRLDIEYDGTDWHGWQTQPNLPTVQQAIENALSTSLRSPASIVGSGRTDAGVHARGQVAHFRRDEPIDTYLLCGSVNGILPDSIVVRGITEADESFHARYDAVQRRYCYQASCLPVAVGRRFRWHIRPAPDFEAMNLAAENLIGEQDFDSFCRANSETKNRICTIRTAKWRTDERPGDWTFEISADRFLHGMVRAIVGTMVEIGHGKRSPGDMVEIISSRDRREAGVAAPSRGLILEEVIYG